MMFGDHRDRFPCTNAIQSLADTCPVTDQSGRRRHVYFRKACNRDHRTTTQQFAKSSIRQAEWAATYFSQGLARGMSNSHAYRCLANRWLGVTRIATIRRKNVADWQVYDEAYHT
ncbi:MAG: transposase [Chloroflexi bacterium]|nr:transposase [Chloroflexota bacterium]